MLVAEIGLNHFGSERIANQFIDELLKTDIDAITFQVAGNEFYKKNRKLKLPNNISLLPLPATSPELNPVEQVWLWIRQHCLANRVFKDFQEIIDVSCDAWNIFAKQADLINSIGSREWATL